MKCQICDGTGTSNTCVNGTFKPCTFCDGTGEYEPFDVDVELDKLYPTELTNEEWFDTLTTHEKAMWLADACGRAVQGYLHGNDSLRMPHVWFKELSKVHKEHKE